MIIRTIKAMLPLFLFLIATSATGSGLEKSREIRPASQMTGTIIAPLDQGKLALSAGDKVLVIVEPDLRFKPGDFLEIFQPVAPRDAEPLDPLLKKVGLAVMLETVQEKLLLCVIDSSTREIAAGDRVYLAGSR